ncbi:MAG TPA: hypothetical protein PKH79_03500 [Prolixibacteraceae bacterium]|nr:hypothetical protein [Prolixibacteraceae bacterium]HPS13335.1 hypothetical protein [Prolixibacteraceae bacterium]
MPYRRLPNTDAARVRAMEKAFRKCLSIGLSNCAFSEETYLSLEIILPQFQHAIINLEAARKNQASKNKEYVEYLRKAKIYISHFIQVLNFAIVRGELKKEILDLYGLAAYAKGLPPLVTEKNLIDWGKKIIEGEQKRIQKGGNPIYNPSIALVKVNYEKFVDAYHFQRNLVSTSKRASKLVNDLRPEADKVILKIWNEVEQTFFQPDDEAQKRENAAEYGISYVFRRKEKLKALNPTKPTVVKKEEIIVTPEEDKPEILELKPIDKKELPAPKTAEKVKKEAKPSVPKEKKQEKMVQSVPVQSSLNF